MKNRKGEAHKMIIGEENVVKNAKKFKELLEKICEDFNIQDSKEIIETIMGKI